MATRLTQALLKAVLLRRRGHSDLFGNEQLELFETQWEDTRTKAKSNRTVFSQRRIRPDDVLPEWRKTLSAIGGRDDVQRFASRALTRLGSGLEAGHRGFKVPTLALPDAVRERLAAGEHRGHIAIDFAYPSAARLPSVQRSHPLIAVLADTMLGRTLAEDKSTASPDDPAALGRVGCWISEQVQGRTTVALLRLRHHLPITTAQSRETTDGGRGRRRWPGRHRNR